MSFPSSIAGPSRIPLQACASSCRRSTLAVSRSYSTAPDQDSSSPSAESSGSPNAVPSFYGADRRGGKVKVKGVPFSVWKQTSGRDLEFPEKGQKAKWLGGNVPYPMNPSFRPPPPLSDEMQEALYREMQAGTKTLGEISAKFNVGRARLDAIRKLKEIEAEYKRQSLPLQTAFQEGMEPLLGSASLVQARWSRDDRGQRASRAEGNESVSVEADEERRWMAGIGDGGAFGNRDKEEEGMERTVFDWRGEDDLLDARAAGLEEAVFPTPDTEKARRQARAKALKSQQGKLPELIIPTKAPTTTWRFVDVSRVGIPQHPQVVQAMEKRTKLTEKKAVQRRKKKGVFE